MSSREPPSILERYVRAARQTGPIAAGTTPTANIEGYWIDDERYDFTRETFDSALGRVVSRPCVADCRSQSVEELARQDAVDGMPQIPPQALASPDGRYACVLKDYDLWLLERATGHERPLTTDGAPHHFYGRHSEMNLSAYTYGQKPYPVALWSPDSKWLLTYRIDERALPELALTQSAAPGKGHFRLYHYKYPTPDDPLPTAVYVAFHVETGRVVTFHDFPVLATSLTPFLVGSAWFGRGERAWVLRFDRYFKHGELIALDLRSGGGRIVLSEAVEAGYIDLHPVFGRPPNVRILDDSDEVVWFSERDGWGHLYLHDAVTGVMKNQITRGQWLVRDIVHIDEGSRKAFFLVGGLDPQRDPAHRCLCSVNLDGAGFEMLLAHDGDLSVSSLSPAQRFAVVQYTHVAQGNVTEMVDLETRRGFTLASELPGEGENVPRTFTAIAADGVTRLHGVMFLPSHFDEGTRYPLIDFIYPGPQYAHQPQSFHAVNAYPARALAELGFVTIMLDTRGIPLRSRAYHQIGYGELLEPQLADHAAVVRQLCQRFSFIEADRIGIIGQSAGGAATARALCDYGDLFKVGVAACGVHDASLHVSMWSDKYRGPPDLESWTRQANTTVAHRLAGKLLLISGDMDECVHVSHTLLLADALIRANRDFEMLIIPNAGHDVLMTHPYAQRKAWDCFVRHLRGEEPPDSFELRFEGHELQRFSQRSAREYR